MLILGVFFPRHSNAVSLSCYSEQREESLEIWRPKMCGAQKLRAHAPHIEHNTSFMKISNYGLHEEPFFGSPELEQ